MKQLITDNEGPFVDRPIFALPVPHTWAHNATVTLLGDAAHLMPPLGVGVHLAMLDASDLALLASLISRNSVWRPVPEAVGDHLAHGSR